MENNSIITLQVGNFSNLIGAHWWNLQDVSLQEASCKEFDSKTMFFKGNSPKFHHSVNFPRVLAVDHIVSSIVESLSFSGVNQNGLLVKEALATARDQFSCSEICSWTDHLEVELHPNSCGFLSTLQWGYSTETFASGVELSMMEGCRDMIEDKIRLLAEEADYLQGFHVLLDMDNRFGGLACGILQNLRDDFGNKAVFSFPVLASSTNQKSDPKRVARIQANVALALSSLQSTSSLITPLSLSRSWMGNSFNAKLAQLSQNVTAVQESALIAVALETITSLWRSKEHRCGMYDAMGHFTYPERKILGASCGFPFQGSKSGAIETITFMPEVDAFNCDTHKTTAYRGENLYSEFQKKAKLYDASSFEERFFQTPCYIPHRFPPSIFFSSSFGSHIYTEGTLHDSPQIGESLRNLHKYLTDKVNRHLLPDLGLEEIDFKEHCCEILNIADAYL